MIMGRPQTNGLIEIIDAKSHDCGFFCMQLVNYLNQECKMGTSEYADLWDLRFSQAKNHQCAYRSKCPIFAKTKSRMEHNPIQLQIDF